MSITDNSSVLNYSNRIGKYLPGIRRWDLIVPPVVLLKTEKFPTFALGVVLVVYQPLAVSASRIFVVRMDVLPHMEAIMFHKVGLFGSSRVEIAPIKNLTKIKLEHSKYDYYFRFCGGVDMLSWIPRLTKSMHLKPMDVAQ